MSRLHVYLFEFFMLLSQFYNGVVRVLLVIDFNIKNKATNKENVITLGAFN